MSTKNSTKQNFSDILRHFRPQRGLAFGVIIITALFAFEVFNFSTTDFALTDFLGDLKFVGLRWATILAIAFCGIDFAGIARLFTPEQGSKEPNEVWYLFGAWLLAATMNAMLTWWGVSLAIVNHETLGNAVIERETLLRVVPIFVAVLVWLIRVLIIGTFSVAGERMFSQLDSGANGRSRSYARSVTASAALSPISTSPGTARASAPVGSKFRPAPKPHQQPETGQVRAEPSYHPLSMSATSNVIATKAGGGGHTSSRPGFTHR